MNSARIASGSFTEQHILNELVSLHIERAQPPFHPDQRRGMSEGMQLKGLFHSQIDCIVYYSGNYWTLVMKENEFVAAAVMEARITEHLGKFGVHYVGRLGFENAYAFAMPKTHATARGIPAHSHAWTTWPGTRPMRRSRTSGH